jgi:hypothetical protein
MMPCARLSPVTRPNDSPTGIEKSTSMHMLFPFETASNDNQFDSNSQRNRPSGPDFRSVPSSVANPHVNG